MTLTKDQLSELRIELESERARLERSMATSAEAAKPVELEQTCVGRLSRMDALQNQQMSVELHDREQARYAQVVDALERLDSGEFGTCMQCTGEIPFGRLIVFPEARICADCAGRAAR